MLFDLARVAVLCNDAALHKHADIWSVEGDPMEGALLTLGEKIGLSTGETRGTWIRTDTIPFDAKHRFMATLHHDQQKHAFIFVKGAPEQVLAMSRAELTTKGTEQALNITYWHKKVEMIAAKGQRVLALAVRSMPPKHATLQLSDVEGFLTLLGLVGLTDPPRPEAMAAIRECHAAGVRVKMITGDHSGTAVAIGHQIGLQNSNRVLTGVDMNKMDDITLATAILETDIFARTSPEHKLRLVTALQAQGMIVAMTGDGVNDAPALKRADVGIAMGKKGSEIAKESSDLVLADDNFASIVAAVCEGRAVHDNLKKVISWTLPTNAGEAMTIIVALLFGMTLPMTAAQILWVNLVTTVTLGTALAFEPPGKNIMHRPPRQKNEPFLTQSLAWHVVLVTILFLCGVLGLYTYAITRGASLALARTVAINTLVIMEIFHLFFIRNIHESSLRWEVLAGTKAIWLTVIMTIMAQLAVTYIPFLQAMFTTEAISGLDWLIMISAGIVFFIIIEIEKRVRLHTMV